MTLPQEDHRLREALAALDRGWIPTPLDGKIPVSKRWNLLSVPTERDVEQWIREGRNIGVRTGSISGIIVIDEDPKNGGAIGHLLQSVGLDRLPPTPTVITGSGGRHYYFRYPRGAKIGNSSRELQSPGIDIRGEGGQVVYPGSIHPETGQVYAWAPTLSPDDVELAELPQPILDRLTKKRGYADAALENEVNRVKAAPEGERNNALNRAAFSLGQLVGGGALDEAQVMTALLAASPLPQREAEATIRSGIDAGKGKPRRPPQAATGAVDAVLVPGAHITDQAEYLEVGTDDFADAVLDAMPHGAIYRRGNVPGDVVGACGNRWFRVLTPDHLRMVADRSARLGKWIQRKDESRLIFQPCTKDLAGLLLSNAETHHSVREIRTLTPYPVYTPGGVRATPGWNDGGIFYDEPPDLVGLQPNPDRAREILEDLIVDFPFRSEADRQNYYGLLLTPILRPMVVGNVPMHLIGASLQGTGKTKLVSEVLGRLLFNRSTAARQFSADENEMKKELLSILIGGDSVIHIDNLMGQVNSPVLSLIVTAEHFGGRILGRNLDAVVRNQVSLVLTGNNVAFSTDNARRVMPIILQPKSAEPERRNDFVYQDLIAHVSECRRVVLEALLGMVDAWIDAGCPPGKTKMGSFEGWASAVGGVLQYHGFDEWGANLREFRRAADPDREDWHTFEARWWETHRDRPARPSDLLALANQCQVFQYALSKASSERSAVTMFAQRVLGKMVNAPVGDSIIRQTNDRNGRVFMLERGSLLG